MKKTSRQLVSVFIWAIAAFATTIPIKLWSQINNSTLLAPLMAPSAFEIEQAVHPVQQPLVVNGDRSILYQQDFSNGFGDMTHEDSSPNGTIWMVANAASPAGEFSSSLPGLASATASNGWVIFDCDLYNTPISNGVEDVTGALISPILDCSGMNSVLVEWSQYFRYCCFTESPLTLEVSTDGGIFWTVFSANSNYTSTANSLSPNPLYSTIDISCVAANQSNVLIRWGYNTAAQAGYSHYYWGIDDIVVSGNSGTYDVRLEPSLNWSCNGSTNCFTDYNYRSYSVPFSQRNLDGMALNLGYENIGSETLTGAFAKVTIHDATNNIVHSQSFPTFSIYSKYLTGNCSNENMDVFVNWAPAIEGEYRITVDLMAAQDLNLSNNSYEKFIKYSTCDFSAQDFTNCDTVISTESNGNPFGLLHSINVPNPGTVANSIKLKFDSSTSVDIPFQILIYDLDINADSPMISVDYVTNELMVDGNFHDFAIPAFELLPGVNYRYGILFGEAYSVVIPAVNIIDEAYDIPEMYYYSMAGDGSYYWFIARSRAAAIELNTCSVCESVCNDPIACNYSPSANCMGFDNCSYGGCTNPLACNFNSNANCDNGSCIIINSPCNDNNPNTFNDVYTSSCNCSGSAFSYGNLDNNTVALCSGENTQIAMIYEPVGLPSYSLQWYYKSGVVNAPFGGSTSGWIAIPGAMTSVVDVNSFVGSRTYACFVTTNGSMGLMSQWANGVSYVNYSSINAQAIIGNPNITPFNNYTYAVTTVVGNTYNWTVTNGAVISGQGTSVVSILWGQNGPYQVTLTESDGTCSGTSVLFAVNNNCTLAVSAASGTTTSFCSGASVQLQAATTATNITYQWYLNGVAIAGETNQNTAATLGGNYQVSITQNGCSAISQILAITELPGITIPTLVVDQLNAGCSGSDATVSLTDANYSNITWSNGTVNTSSINVSESGSYSVTVTDNNGCTATSSAVDVNLSLVSVVPICLVTVDQVTGKNNVVWEPVTSDMINSYVVLKETNVANVYAQIGTVAYGSNGLFEDVNANPQVQANRYKLALIDTCGILSSNSDFHKTIHLSTNQGLGNNVNLIWSGYEGFDFGSYNIYRGASAASMTLLTTIASNLNSYTDINPPVGDVYYMIEVEGVSCDPQRTLVYSHSNVITTTTDGVDELSNAISLYPNPATTSINLQVNTSLLGQEYVVFDAVGKVILKDKITSTLQTISTSELAGGNYILKVETRVVKLQISK